MIALLATKGRFISPRGVCFSPLRFISFKESLCYYWSTDGTDDTVSLSRESLGRTQTARKAQIFASRYALAASGAFA